MGTLAGALMIWILFNIVLLLDLDVGAQRIVKGVVIVLAVPAGRSGDETMRSSRPRGTAFRANTTVSTIG